MIGRRNFLRNGSKNLKDLYTRLERTYDPHWDILDPNKPVRPMRDIVSPIIPICEVPGKEADQEVIDCHLIPRLLQIQDRGLEKAKCGTYFVKNPNWIEPPPTARCLDIFTDPSVAVTAVVTQLITFTVPDRFIGVINAIGMELDDAAEWGNVEFRIEKNEAPIDCYGEFSQQLGRFVEPTKFGAPLHLKHRDVIQVTGRKTGGVASTNVFFRFQGFMYPAKTVTDDGTFGKFHTL